MSYSDRFLPADEYIQHTNAIVKTIDDPLLKQRYTGFVVTTGVTSYELAIKDIFLTFSYKKHNVFGIFIEGVYEHINGRITIGELKQKHVRQFGEKYYRRFSRVLKERELQQLRATRRSISSSYGNVITWRHSFIHQGEVPQNANYDEAVRAFVDGKQVIEVLAKVMVR